MNTFYFAITILIIEFYELNPVTKSAPSDLTAAMSDTLCSCRINIVD